MLSIDIVTPTLLGLGGAFDMSPQPLVVIDAPSAVALRGAHLLDDVAHLPWVKLVGSASDCASSSVINGGAPVQVAYVARDMATLTFTPGSALAGQTLKCCVAYDADLSGAGGTWAELVSQQVLSISAATPPGDRGWCSRRPLRWCLRWCLLLLARRATASSSRGDDGTGPPATAGADASSSSSSRALMAREGDLIPSILPCWLGT